MESYAEPSVSPNCSDPLSRNNSGNEKVDNSEFLCSLETAISTHDSKAELNGNFNLFFILLLAGQITAYFLTLMGNFIVFYVVCAVKKFRR